MFREPRSSRIDRPKGRIAKQEKRLQLLCVIVASVMLLSLLRYLFE